jgi:hypothetical protein
VPEADLDSHSRRYGHLDGLAASGLRENWESGDHSMQHPYQPTL